MVAVSLKKNFFKQKTAYAMSLCDWSSDVCSSDLQYFGHLIPRANSLEKTLILGKTEGRRRRGQQRMRCLDGITDSMDVNLSQVWETVKVSEAWRAAVHGTAKSWTQLNY